MLSSLCPLRLGGAYLRKQVNHRDAENAESAFAGNTFTILELKPEPELTFTTGQHLSFLAEERI